jgi:hypothetical protein
MTDGIDPTRPRREPDYLHTDPPPVRKAVSLPLPDPADLPDASFGPLPRVKTNMSAHHVADPIPTALQQNLDTFLERARPRYVVDGNSVQVPIPFRMTVDVTKLPASSPWRTQEGIVRGNLRELQTAAASVGLSDDRHLGLFRSGRATPEDVRKVTQALIDRGHLPPMSDETPDAASRVRKMMFDHGLGLDCAAYTQQAFLASLELTRGQTLLNPEVTNEDLTNLAREGFRKVPIDAARPGDILVLDPRPGSHEPGHTLIAYDRREATAEELAELRTLPGFGKGHITAYVLDSSFGSEGTFGKGGVMRQIWWRNDDEKSWAVKRDPRGPDDPEFIVWAGQPPDNNPTGPRQDRPYYLHLVKGFYRPAGERL